MDVEIQQALEWLPQSAASPPPPGVRGLAELVDGDLPLQSFLEQLLPQLCSLFGGVAAVAWLKAHGASDAVFGVRYQMDKLLASVAEQRRHERLVQMAWQHRQPLLAEAGGSQAAAFSLASTAGDLALDAEASPLPTGSRGHEGQSALVAESGTQNSTGHALLFGPILHLGEPIALLEVALLKPPGAGAVQRSPVPLTPAQRQLYLRSIKLVAERVYGGLRRRMAMPAARIDKAVEQLEKLTAEVHALQQQISQRIERRLQTFQGWAFGSLAENQAFAKLVHQILDSHGLRVVCPECGHPAILRCLRVGNAKHGAFVFDHYLDNGRTFHGGPSTVPLIRVVAKPARRPTPHVSS